jgi:hypothetical protein
VSTCRLSDAIPKIPEPFQRSMANTSLKRPIVLSPYCTSLLFATGELPRVSPDLPRYHGRAVLGLSPGGNLGRERPVSGTWRALKPYKAVTAADQDAGEPETVAGKSSLIDHLSGAGPLASVSLMVGVTSRPSVLSGSCWVLEAWRISAFCQYALVLTPFTICRVT